MKVWRRRARSGALPALSIRRWRAKIRRQRPYLLRRTADKRTSAGRLRPCGSSASARRCLDASELQRRGRTSSGGFEAGSGGAASSLAGLKGPCDA
jgi:hypothetical protein